MIKPNVTSLAVLGLLAGCSSSTSPTAVRLVEVVSGDGQTVSVAQVASGPLTVKIVDGNGAPVPDVAVGFSSRIAAALSTAPNTDANGMTQSTVTAGTYAATDTITATTDGGTTSGTFILTITPGAPDTLRILAGNGQVAAPGTTLGHPFVIDVKDKYLNNIEGASVLWTTTSGSLTAATTTTGTGGITQVTLTLPNTVGVTRVTARVPGADSVTFEAEAR